MPGPIGTGAATSINGGGMIVQAGLNQVSLSRIFYWYQRDFEGRFGVLNLILAHFREEAERDYLQGNLDKVRFKYQKYDWSLNHI